MKIEKDATVEELNQEVTTEEEIMALKEQVAFLTEAWTSSQEAYKELLEGIARFAEKDKKDKEELSRWATETEQRIGKVIVQQVNLSLIVDTAVELTDEQKLEIQRKVESLKKKNTSK